MYGQPSNSGGYGTSPRCRAPIEVRERCLSHMTMAKAGHTLSAVATVTGVTAAGAVTRTAGR